MNKLDKEYLDKDGLDSLWEKIKACFQPKDADLTAIAALTGTSGLLKKTAANTWALHTSTLVTIAGTNLSLGGSISAATLGGALTKIGTASKGASNRPIYLDAGTPTAVTSVGEAFLSWGGKNFSGSYAPIDAAVNPVLGANRLAGFKAAGTTIEYSTDGGTTWTDYGLSDANKIALFTTSATVNLAGPSAKAGSTTANNMLRITLDAINGGVYSQLWKWQIYLSTTGSTSCKVKIESYDYNSSTSWHEIIAAAYLSGWPGWNVLNFSLPGSGSFGGNNNNTHQRKIRLTFSNASCSTTYAGLQIYKIYAYGGVGWAAPSILAANGVPYSYDSALNVTFPAKVTASSFSGPLTGNVTGNCSGTAGSVAWSGVTGKPTTLSGYGITDAKISNGVITLGNNTITPLTSHQSLASCLKLSGGTMTGSITMADDVALIKSTTNGLSLLGYVKSSTGFTGVSSGFWIGSPSSSIVIRANAAPTIYRGSAYTNLDSGNYSSYALPLSGGTMTGPINASGASYALLIGSGSNKYGVAIDGSTQGNAMLYHNGSSSIVGALHNATTTTIIRGNGNLIHRKAYDGTGDAVILDALNYTSYVNTTNFPGLNKTGTVTSVKVGTTSYSPSSGVVSLPAYPTLASLMGSSAKGNTTTPVYWTGSAWATCTAFENARVNSAASADKITNLTSTDQASSSTTWRRVWMCYTDNVNGRPAWSDGFVYQTSTNTLKTKKFLAVSASGEQNEFVAQRTGGSSVALMVGTGNANHGVYSITASKWLIVSDASGNVTVNGNASSATKATQDGNGNTITSTYLKLSGGTLTGALSVQTSLTINNHDAGSRAHLEFKREGKNFIVAPSNGSINFCIGTAGKFSIYSDSVAPDVTNVTDLGSENLKWKDVYANNFRGALIGNANTATKATQDANGNIISSTYLKLAGGTLTGDLTVSAEISARAVNLSSSGSSGYKNRWQILCTSYPGTSPSAACLKITSTQTSTPLDCVFITRTGNVGIGGTFEAAIADGYKLSVDGNVKASGGVVGYLGVSAHGISDLTSVL